MSFLAQENEILERIAGGAPLPEVLELLCLKLESLLPGAICSVLLVEDGRLQGGAAPGLPSDYSCAFDGASIGPRAASCGTAAFTGKPVIVSDIATDPLWDGYRDLALPRGLRACWSTPIFGEDGGVVGTFATYYREPRAPGPRDPAIQERAAHLASIAICRDRAERRLRETAERVSILLEYAPDAIIVFDADLGRFVECNRNACRLFGLSRERLLACGPADLSPPAQPDGRLSRDAVREHLRMVFDGETPVFEWTHRDAAGRDFPCEVRLVRFPARGRRLVRGSVVDISERRRLEEQVRHVQKLESLGVLAGGIAHDFNNLLTSVLGNAELALEDLPEDAPARTPVLAAAEAARRAAELTGQMLAYAGRGRFARARVRLPELVEEIERLLRASISRQATVRRSFAPDTPAVDGDPAQLRQVAMNLVTNASDALGGGPGVVEIATRALRADRAALSGAYLDDDLPEGLYACLEVSDTGCGMDAETAARVFDPFFTTKPQGRGLGLAAVLGIVRGHRGAIQVRSEPGRGSTFRLLLPAAPGAAPAEAPEADRGPWRGAGLALVAEDDDAVREVAVRMLERSGFRVAAARDGLEAERLFAERPGEFALALVDLTMPGRDGRRTLAALRALRPDLPTILMSGFDEREAASEADVADAFLQKPFSPAELLDRVRALLGGGAP